MAKKKSLRYYEEMKTSYMFPSLHPDIQNTVSDEIISCWFNLVDSSRDAKKTFSTHVLGDL
ncbi:hypothetical protein EJ04DRAFT_513466 [Polyplosphaeria fusca]|uniref:Uncharacterized protein n=1 Tax=Polyplosphaeria fusca TaxID=682080 RepID=A0A9P4V1E9_9PLEO|nr:hypothetical protein EJ04DRAFT_513466 [Polyplosphaeria fusca]